MVAHRKNVPAGKAYVPSSWFIVLTVMVVIGGAGWLGWLLVDDDSSGEASPSASAPTATATVEPTEAEPSEAEPTEPEPARSSETPAPEKTTPEPTASTPTAPVTQRTAIVSVLNNSGIGGAARTFSGKVAQAGWQLGGVGNWTGAIDGNTIYYAPGLQQQAQLLAGDVGIQRVRPAVTPMRMDRLTIILSRPR
jgi:hypothetical protein|nr:hypothetical protein [Aeromicrobium sp.]